ncbi:cell wall-binding protein [Clostridium botulinum]|uniref:Cell wall-binding protein n=1 Tax=Clostridium botulinum TaxID=1491 RepID=A0A6B4JPZ5_CLOBO|nr:transglutaminase-like domain-containing protein [Clostridium botulinum]EES50833.1 cell wall binding repeat protein [Clostridium botulinum E1 str. 'BoNT E Beluga']MBN1063608.1 cell wall-binding protein [Clostridium botulinum]MBY6762560.1 cell wall-binding protein [Clostridium botulinum]MBY6920990.1 cell wall-binding protein [Clostridium botulinum]MCR1132909.1 cell wall-binding protein [Clostridium botulinum]
MKGLKNTLKVILIGLIIIASTNINVYASETFYDSNKLKNEIYNNLKDWKTDFTLNYEGDNIQSILDSAIDSEDYLERSVSSYNIKINGEKNKFAIQYRTTKSQEDFIDYELKRIVNNLIDKNMSTVDKVVAINNYLVKIYKYDYSIKSDNVYSALTTKETICQGYAMTAYKMFKLLGIESRIVSGTMNGTGHAWNLVNIDRNWYNLDITNNDNVIRDKYLLVSDEFLINNGFHWNKSKYPTSYYNYYNTQKTFTDYNNDNENDIVSYYNGGYWYIEKGYWHYFRFSGKDARGWLNNDGNWYYFDNDGKMKVGWLLDNGTWYYCYSNGQMAYNTMIGNYRLDENGALIS